MGPSTKDRPWLRAIALIVLFLAAFALRWAFVRNTFIDGPIRADAMYYAIIGHNLAQRGVFSQEAAGPPFRSDRVEDLKSSPSDRDPGYPFFLAAVVKATRSFQGFYTATLWLQCLLGSLTVLFSYFIARFVLPPAWSGLAAVLTMLSPHLVSLSAYVLTETLFTFLLQGGALLFLMGIRHRKPLLFASSGLALGMAICVRAVLQLFPFLLAAAIYLAFRKERAFALRSAAIFLAASFTFFVPWNVWKSARFGDQGGSPSLMAQVLYAGSYIGNVYNDVPPGKPRYGIGMVTRDDPEFYKVVSGGYKSILSEIAKRFRAHPFEYSAWYLYGKTAMLWRWNLYIGEVDVYPTRYTLYDRNGLARLTKNVMRGIHPFLVVLMHISALLLLVRQVRMDGDPATPLAILVALVLYFEVILSILGSDPRYSIPLRPQAYIIGLFAVFFLGNKFWNRAKQPHPGSGAR